MQHPAQGGAHQRGDQDLANPGVAKQLAGGEHEALRGWIHRHVGGALDDVETLEMDPHGMGGIGEPAVSERVAREQIAELVIEVGLRKAEDWNQAHADRNDAESYKE